jgi:hypothetical protein
MTTTVDKSTLTRRQIETLEAVYHTGSPWKKKAKGLILHFSDVGAQGHTGGAVSRMVDELKRRRYVTTESIPSALTVKGLEALSRDKTAMKAIDERELQERIKARLPIENKDAAEAERIRAERAHHAQKRQAESRATRLEKLRQLIGDSEQPIEMDDEALLAFAARIADIELIY